MSTDDRSAIVAHMDDQAVNSLLSLLSEQDVEVVGQPRTGLVMMPLTDSFLTDFNLGEVLVTEARVNVAGSAGYGLVTGDNPRRALARAAAEALLAGADCPVRILLEDFLEKQKELRRLAHEQERILTATTRVNFDLMAGA